MMDHDAYDLCIIGLRDKPAEPCPLGDKECSFFSYTLEKCQFVERQEAYQKDPPGPGPEFPEGFGGV